MNAPFPVPDGGDALLIPLYLYCNRKLKRKIYLFLY